MFRHPPLPLVILLLSFPQIVETIYSPALPMIASAYRASPQQAAQTLSLWFVAFAFGVVAWGRLCDIAGRRPALLGGLALYALGSVWAMMAGDFGQLLTARLISAFGAAAGSIVTQTALRDSYRGTDLARVFSLLGMALAISPAIGMFAGQDRKACRSSGRFRCTGPAGDRSSGAQPCILAGNPSVRRSGGTPSADAE
jgi:MFS family permease